MKLKIPFFHWIKTYNRTLFGQDLVAAIVVTMLLIPQSLAYSLLAGLPPEVGLYSSILPLTLYAFFGSSSTLSVGPVALVSLMTATALGEVAQQGTASYLTGAITLALLSGAMLLSLGLLRFGMISNLLSHGVISGFVAASGIIIALSQIKHLFGVSAQGDTLTELVPALASQVSVYHAPTLVLGVCVLIFLWCCRQYLCRALLYIGLPEHSANALSKLGPIAAVLASIVVSHVWQLEATGVAVTGTVPNGLPTFALTLPSLALIEILWTPALMISIISYVESISVGKTLGSKRHESIDADQELVGLGIANLGAGISGGFPVAAGFSRSAVNFDAGAKTQFSSILAGIGMLFTCLFLTPLLYHLPKATLAATIIIAILPLIDFTVLRRTATFSKSDYYAVLATILITLFVGVEAGVGSGVALSIGFFLYRTSRPHIAEVGLVEGTEHFRNVQRYKVLTDPKILSLRIDESLFFANASHVEERIQKEVFQHKEISEVILQFSGINELDFSALELLEALNHQLQEQGICLHLSEVKGPVMDRLKQSGFLEQLSGKLFLTHYEAFQTLRCAGNSEAKR